MNNFIFDFNGEVISLPYSVSSMTAFLSHDLKIEHNGKLYIIGEKVISGFDARTKEFQKWNGESELKTEMNLVFKMIEI